MRRRARGERGAAATEFVLITPLLIMLFFGIVQIGLATYRQQVIEAAAREGARVAAVGGDRDEIRAAVQDAAVGFDGSEVPVPDSDIDLCTALPDDATVVVVASGSRLNYEIPFVGSFTATFRAEATFRCEQVAS